MLLFISTTNSIAGVVDCHWSPFLCAKHPSLHSGALIILHSSKYLQRVILPYMHAVWVPLYLLTHMHIQTWDLRTLAVICRCSNKS